jgi:hypothetical protein
LPYGPPLPVIRIAFQPSKIKERVTDLRIIEDLYQQIQPALSILDLSNEGIRYYASSVLKSDMSDIARRRDEDRHLHVLAFIAHQYYRLQDNLVEVLLASLRSYQTRAQKAHKDQRYARRSEHNQVIKKLLHYIDDNVLSLLTIIHNITQDMSLTDAKKIAQIKAILPQADETEFINLRDQLGAELKEDDYYQILETRSLRLQNRVSPILRDSTSQGREMNHQLFKLGNK